MKLKSLKHLIIIGVAFIATLLAYFWFIKSVYFPGFLLWAQDNFLLLFLILILIKIIGIVWPPIPGAVLTIGSIPIIGWLPAYLADLIGILIGSGLAYYLGKKYGFVLLEKIFDQTTVKKIKQIKIKPQKEIESITMLRLFGGGIIVEVVSYAAGLLKISFKKFIIASILSHMLIGIPFFYFAFSLFSRKNLILNLILMAIILTIFIKFRSRYLERTSE